MKWFITGSVLIGLSGPLVGKFAFQGMVFPVVLGLLFFVTGYRFIQFGKKESANLDWLTLWNENKILLVKNEAMLFIGVLMASYGFMMGAESTSTLEASKMLGSGILVVTGYVLGHVGGNHAII